jgi:REP element-mobilizing transposase RayT
MHDRKSWIEHRLEELAEIFSVAVAGFAILGSHLHLLVRLDPDVAQGCVALKADWMPKSG